MLRREDFFRLPWLLIVLVAMVVVCPGLSAQTLTIRLLNAKSGKPLRDQTVTLEWAKDIQHSKDFPPSSVTMDHEGIGHVDVPSGASGFSLLPGSKPGKEPSRFAYFNCNQTGLIAVEEVLQMGVVPNNGCGASTVPRQRGQVVLWALPNSWVPTFP
jgi:hypothetical protein